LADTRFGKLTFIVMEPGVRLEVYKRVRTVFKGVKALCAATMSEYLIRAGYLSGHRPWTATLSRDLEKKGAVRFDSLARCEPYTLCYSVDSNGNGAPDHVYLFMRWLDKERAIAEVIDNYSVHPHPRNLKGPCWYKGRHLSNGRFWYGQILPK
jgi:hypothetical protein